jgi:hypothetical protein
MKPLTLSPDSAVERTRQMKIGFTGTREGLTQAQHRSLVQELSKIGVPFIAHHGDCVGADEAFHNEVLELGMPIVIHPPVIKTLRVYSFCATDIRPEKPYLARNRDIVNETDRLIACPQRQPLPEKGGTAYTVRYAQQKGKPVYIIWPDGTVALP